MLKILTEPDPSLRRKARPVKAFGPEIAAIVDDMTTTLRLAGGVGLAAPQVGIGKRIIVVELGEGGPVIGMVNPAIEAWDPQMVTSAESCLSIPGIAGEIERHQWVSVSYQVPSSGTRREIDVTGLLARCLQHEIDHLNGVLFTDNATRIWNVL